MDAKGKQILQDQFMMTAIVHWLFNLLLFCLPTESRTSDYFSIVQNAVEAEILIYITPLHGKLGS